MTEKGILDVARQVGFKDERSLRKLMRIGATVEIGKAAKSRVARGSKIGGLPLLPKGEAWPTHEGRSLAFLAQFDLADVPPAVARELPRQGMLSFFYIADEETWGHQHEDAGKFAVLHIKDLEAAGPAAGWPKDLGKEQRFSELPATFKETMTLAPWESDLVQGAVMDDGDRDLYSELAGTLKESEGEENCSQLLGHPWQIQGDMAHQCAVVSGGISMEDDDYESHPRYRKLAAGAKDWRLLLQLHSIRQAGMCWGDVGSLYFWTREQDLKDRRFEKCWMILQCY